MLSLFSCLKFYEFLTQFPKRAIRTYVSSTYELIFKLIAWMQFHEYRLWLQSTQNRRLIISSFWQKYLSRFKMLLYQEIRLWRAPMLCWTLYFAWGTIDIQDVSGGMSTLLIKLLGVTVGLMTVIFYLLLFWDYWLRLSSMHSSENVSGSNSRNVV